MRPRVLILTASVGEGHDLPARMLARELEGDADVTVEDALAPMGRLVTAVSEDGARVAFLRVQWAWDVTFWLAAQFAPTRRLFQWLLTTFGGRGLERLIRRERPDVVVSVYPQATEVLGWLRRSGRIDVPAVAAVTDLAAMHYWAARGIDCHLVTHPESIPEVRRVAGDDAEIVPVQGLTSIDVHPPDRAEARASLGLPATGKVVLVSGGGWGVGDIEGAIETALESDVAQVVCLCGRNDELRGRLASRFDGNPRVRVEGFTDRMGDWMAAADALVHSTGGLTVLEAHMRGCPTISYGWGRGHLRVNNRAFAEHGLAEVATTRRELRRALARALATRRAPDLSFAALPTAASIVLAIVSAL